MRLALHFPSATVYYRLALPLVDVVAARLPLEPLSSRLHPGKKDLPLVALSRPYRLCRDCLLCRQRSLDVQEVRLLA